MKEYHLDIGLQQEKKRTVHDVSLLDPTFREVFDTFPFVQEGLELLREKSPWKFDHTIRVGQISLELARKAGLSDEEQDTITVAAMLHDVAMVDDDLVDLTNSTVSLVGEPLRFLIDEHPRRAAEAYATKHCNASLLIGAHSLRPSESELPHHLRELQSYLYLADQVDARMSYRPYRTLAETQTPAEVIAALSNEYSEIILESATSYQGKLYKKPTDLPQAA